MQHNRLPTFENLQGNVPAVREFEVNFDTTAVATGAELCKVLASVAKPVLLEITAQVVTAFNAATTNVLTLGDSADSGIDNYLAAADITEGTPGFYPAGGVVRVRLEADSTIMAKYAQTGTAATTGKVRFIIRFTPLWD